jgi:hypothetical protein
MSDGLTEAWRMSRKITYLNSIELKKDELFDSYKELTKRLLIVSKNLAYASRSKMNIFGKWKPDYEYIKELEKLRFEIEIRLEETEKLINKLDNEYIEVEKKPLKDF